MSLSMIISEIVSGEGLTMGQASRLVPAHRGDKPIEPNGKWKSTSPETVWRWVVRGHTLPDGSLVKLEAAKMAGRWLTTKQALARFILAITSASTQDAATPPPKPRSEKSRSDASRRAAEKLQEMGA